MAYSSKDYSLTIKHNLRTFLGTQNYIIDEYGSFTGIDQNKTKHPTLKGLADEISIYALKKEIAIDVSKPEEKLRKMLSDEYDAVDPFFISLICSLYDFPLEYIYSPEKTDCKNAANIMSQVEVRKKLKTKPLPVLSPLTHKAYFGDFYGYTYDHNPNEEEHIIKFKLSIYEDNDGTPKAEYSFYNKDNKKQIFKGIPYYLTELKTIFIEMYADGDRRYQYLHFNGKGYGRDKLTYKCGICVRTSSASEANEPDVKSFIITGNELPEDIAQKIVPGLLKMVGDEVYITAPCFDKLRNTDPDIADFCNNYNSFIRLIDNSIYLIPELRILDSVKRATVAERIAVFECLTKIKKLSLAPNRIIYRNAEADYNYFKQLEEALIEALSQ